MTFDPTKTCWSCGSRGKGICHSPKSANFKQYVPVDHSCSGWIKKTTTPRQWMCR